MEPGAILITMSTDNTLFNTLIETPNERRFYGRI